jgi:hypothetical protein
MEPHLETHSAISFVTAAIRIPTEWESPLLASDDLDLPRKLGKKGEALPQRRAGTDQDWEIQTYANLVDHFSKSVRGKLFSLGELAKQMQASFGPQLAEAAPAGLLEVRQQSGMLESYKLSWLNSPYFSLPDPPVDDSTVVSFVSPEGSNPPPWREYLFVTDEMSKSLTSETTTEAYHEYAAIYDVLGLVAQRRSLISTMAQRRMCKIVLPWARCHFRLTNGTISRPYLIVPVITLLGRRATSQFRRTFTLTMFLLPNCTSDEPPLDLVDLAAICQQAVWSETSPPNPVLFGPAGLVGPAFEGPLRTLIVGANHHLLEVFDAVLAKVIAMLGVVPKAGSSNSIQTLIAISRKHSVIFGSGLHVAGEHSSEIWSELTKRENRELAEQLGRLLSVNAARQGREWLVGGDGFRLPRMRVTNPYEEDVSTIVLYNPMSRFMVNILPKSHDRFPTASVTLGVSWLNLLAAMLSSIKEILRSYRYEIEQYRNRIELLGTGDDPGTLLKAVHKSTLTILEEIDVVYSFDLVTPTYRAAHTRILDMEGIGEERTNLMRELEIMTALLRSEETDQLNRKIARSTSSTDSLTFFVVVFSALSVMLVTNGLIEFYHRWPFGTHGEYFWSLVGDGVILSLAIVGFIVHRMQGPGR